MKNLLFVAMLGIAGVMSAGQGKPSPKTANSKINLKKLEEGEVKNTMYGD